MTSNYWSKIVMHIGFLLDQGSVDITEVTMGYRFKSTDLTNLEYWNTVWVIHRDADYVVHNSMHIGSRTVRMPESVSKQIAEMSAPHAVMAKLSYG